MTSRTGGGCTCGLYWAPMLGDVFNLMRTKRLLIAIGVTIAGQGCARPQPAVPQSPDDRIREILELARAQDADAVPELIEELDHADVGVRYCAILSLERITGTRLGFRANASTSDRYTAIRAWREFAVQPPSPRAAGGPESTR